MKPETEIRNLKRELRELVIRLAAVNKSAVSNKWRTEKAEHEAKEWERRFDIAMSKIPEAPQ